MSPVQTVKGRTCASCTGTPGEMAIRSTPANVSSANAPVTSSAAGAAARSAPTLGGACRLSATRTAAPSRASHLAVARPLSPSPSTSACLLANSLAVSGS